MVISHGNKTYMKSQTKQNLCVNSYSFKFFIEISFSSLSALLQIHRMFYAKCSNNDTKDTFCLFCVKIKYSFFFLPSKSFHFNPYKFSRKKIKGYNVE